MKTRTLLGGGCQCGMPKAIVAKGEIMGIREVQIA